MYDARVNLVVTLLGDHLLSSIYIQNSEPSDGEKGSSGVYGLSHSSLCGPASLEVSCAVLPL